MPVTPATVKALEPDFPGIRVAAHRTDRLLTQFLSGRPVGVAAVAVTVRGIRGGGSHLFQDYALVLDVTRIEASLPRVWVCAPDDAEIRHVNIFKSTRPHALCPWLGLSLPQLCWHTFENAWTQAARHERTLGAVLEFARQLLNTENHDSPAR